VTPKTPQKTSPPKKKHWGAQKDIASGKWATRSLEQPVVNQTCDDRLCLFNLRTDPFERNDVAALNPAVVAKLVARIGE